MYFVLRKNFKTKQLALNHFRDQMWLFSKPENSKIVYLDEDTHIKKSDIDFLWNNYLTKNEEWKEHKFKGKKPFAWCIAFKEVCHSYEYVNGEPAWESYWQPQFAYKLDPVESNNLGSAVIPVNLQDMFSCFGSEHGVTPKMKELKAARREAGNPYLQNFRGIKLNERGEYVNHIYGNKLPCFQCEKFYAKNDVVCHHVTPFKNLWQQWKEHYFKVNPKETLEISFSGRIKGKAGTDWFLFHKSRAIYLLVCRDCHDGFHQKRENNVS